MNEREIYERLGRIEQAITSNASHTTEKLDELCSRLDAAVQEQKHGMYGPGGLEPRVRKLEVDLASAGNLEPRLRGAEMDLAIIKSKAGMIATIVSAVMFLMLWIAEHFFLRRAG